MEVAGVQVAPTADGTNGTLVVLKEKQGSRFLSIWIGPPEAVSIAYAKNGTHQNAIADDNDYALPHFLLSEMLKAVSVQLLRVDIVAFIDGVFFSDLVLSNGGKVSARPSDSIALALRTGAEIFLSAQILDDMGTVDEDGVLQSDTAAPQQAEAAVPALQRTGEPLPAPPAEGQTRVAGVRVLLLDNQPAAVLEVEPGNKLLTIGITPVEAVAIMHVLEKSDLPRPLTHDLFCDVLRVINVELLNVSIFKSGDEVFGCDLTLSDGNVFRARPGDSIALALRTRAEILVTAAMLGEFGATVASPVSEPGTSEG